MALNHLQAPPSSFINYAMQPAVRTVRLVQPIALIPHPYPATLNATALSPRFPPRHSRYGSTPSGSIRQPVFIQSKSHAGIPSDPRRQFKPTSWFIALILMKRRIPQEKYFFSSRILTLISLSSLSYRSSKNHLICLTPSQSKRSPPLPAPNFVRCRTFSDTVGSSKSPFLSRTLQNLFPACPLRRGDPSANARESFVFYPIESRGPGLGAKKSQVEVGRSGGVVR